MISILHNWQTGKMDWKKPPERWFSSFFFGLKNPNLLRIDVICSGFFKFRIKLLKSIIILLFCGSGLWIPTVFFFLYKTDLDQSDKKTEIFSWLTNQSAEPIWSTDTHLKS